MVAVVRYRDGSVIDVIRRGLKADEGHRPAVPRAVTLEGDAYKRAIEARAAEGQRQALLGTAIGYR